MDKQTYISIPITGHNIEEQKEKANAIKAKIPNSITPFDICSEKNKSYGYYMGKDVEYILDNCDTIFFCKNWSESNGCYFEYDLAKRYGLNIIFEE